MLTIIAISDTHGVHPKNLPEADLLIHAGDWSSSGNHKETETFMTWLKQIKHKYSRIVCIPGNHDIWIEKNESQAKQWFQDNDLDLLIDDYIETNGIKIYGTPWCPQFGNWSYMKDLEFRARKASFIPDDTNILVSHSPAHGILDTLDNHGSEPGKKAGCYGILQAIERIKPTILISGHIHEGFGFKKHGETSCFNVAALNSQYKPQSNYTRIEI